MPKDKTESHKRVIEAAKQEFLEKGFEKASMRSIGEKVGMTPAGLYRHFKDKEDMFAALVEPALNALSYWYDKHMDTSYEIIDNDYPLENLASAHNMIEFFKQVVYTHADEFTLITKCSQGTKYENFVNDFIKKEQRDFRGALDHIKSRGIKIKEISDFELHMLISAYTTALLEPFMHNLSIDDLKHCFHVLDEFFRPGWSKLMGI